MDPAMEEESTFVIIGGGISGVSCAEGIAFLAPEEKVTLVTSSPLVKTLKNIVPLGKTLLQFDIEEKEGEFLSKCHPSITVLQNTVIKVHKDDKIVELDNNKRIRYSKLCLCNGGKPKLIVQDNPYVIGIRDTESVVNFSRKIKDARRIVVIGNGGIATEIVHEAQGVEMIWVIKDKHISATFIDPGAAEFFQDKLTKGGDPSPTSSPTKRMKYTVSDGTVTKGGPALGPDWHNNLKIEGTCTVSTTIQVEYESEVKRILLASEVKETDEEWPVYAELTTGKVIGCDFIVSATGVIPNSDLSGLESLKKGEDAGFLVDWKLETSEKGIYAAGDVCTANWDLAQHWFQMRLWTQAHQMGRYAAKSMVHGYRKEEFFQDFCFELFTHVTKFFGYKVVLIGLYNAQKLNKSYDILLRMTRGKEYIKLVMLNGKMQGAVLIGDTDLEEMCENLILNQLDLSMYGEDLLNPDIDIEDYFD